MARVRDNYVVQGLSGKIGKHLVFKTNKSGLTYTSRPPDRRNVVSTKAQKKLRNNFAKAVAYAKSVLKDPVKAEQYQSRKNKSLYITAMKDYLNQHRAVLKKAGRVIISNDYILKHRLDIRQVKALRFIQKRGRISNSDYQRLNHISKPTATRDLQDLVKKAILNPSGIRGAGAFYELIGSDS
jgi:hypothetical protein